MQKNTYLKDIREKDLQALFLELKKLDKKLIELQFKASFRKLKNHQEISKSRKNIARVWTILAEKTLIEMKNQQSQEKKG